VQSPGEIRGFFLLDIERGAAFRIEKHWDGSIIWLNISVSAVRDASGKTTVAAFNIVLPIAG